MSSLRCTPVPSHRTNVLSIVQFRVQCTALRFQNILFLNSKGSKSVQYGSETCVTHLLQCRPQIRGIRQTKKSKIMARKKLIKRT